MEFDARIRNATNGKRSLDDFCAIVFGGAESGLPTVSLDIAEIISILTDLADEPWDLLIKRKLNQTQDEFAPEDVRLSGYRFEYTDNKSLTWEAREKFLGLLSFYESIGFAVEMEGCKIKDIVPDSPADKAGLFAGVGIIGVNDKKYSYERLEDAVRNSSDTGKIKLFVLESDNFREALIQYNRGLRYYTIVPIKGKRDWLSEIGAPRVKSI